MEEETDISVKSTASLSLSFRVSIVFQHHVIVHLQKQSLSHEK